MNLKTLKESYKAGSIPKPEYIEAMHKLHSALFEYPEFIKNTDIAKIEITDHGVVMTSRKDGIQLICDPKDFRIAPIEILNFGNYEMHEVDRVTSLVEPGATVLDIGANIGLYSMSLAKRVPNIRVFAFEPMPKTFKYLSRHIEMNRIANVSLFNFGFSDQAGEKTFYFYPEGSGNASLSNLTQRDDVEKIHATVSTVDEFVSSKGLSVDFVKCDVEGAELFVFKGALKTLQKDKPVIFTEMLRKWSAGFGYHPSEIISLLGEIGYICLGQVGTRFEVFSKIEEVTEQTNFFFLHPDRHAMKIERFRSGL